MAVPRGTSASGPAAYQRKKPIVEVTPNSVSAVRDPMRSESAPPE
ncbi:hypothetical protein ACFQJD_18275 [Haloplanus sp. GCM10025708]